MYQYKIVKIFLEQYESQYAQIFKIDNRKKTKIQNFFIQKLSTINNDNWQPLFEEHQLKKSKYNVSLFELILIYGNTIQVKKSIDIINNKNKKIFALIGNRRDYYSKILKNVINHAPIENILVILDTSKNFFNYTDGKFQYYLLDSHFNNSENKFSEIISNPTFREDIKKNTNSILRTMLTYNDYIFYSLEKNIHILDNQILNTKVIQEYIKEFFEYFYPNILKPLQQTDILKLVSGLSREDDILEFSDDELITKIYQTEKNLLKYQQLRILPCDTVNKLLNHILEHTPLRLDIKNILEKIIINQSMLNVSMDLGLNKNNNKMKLKL